MASTTKNGKLFDQSSTKPARFAPVLHDRGIVWPAPPNRPGANPAPVNRGPTNPPQSLQTPANRPQQTGQTPANNPTRSIPGQLTGANRTGPNPRPNNRPIAGGQSPRKRAKQPTRANPQQNPNNPANGANCEVSAN